MSDHSIISFSLSHIFFVLLHVSAQNLFDRAKQSFKSVSVYPYYLAWSRSLDACLSHRVLNQCNFSEIISFLIWKNCLWLSTAVLHFLSDQIPFSNHIKSISAFSLLHDVLFRAVAFLFQWVTKLLFLIMVHFRENLDFWYDFIVVFSFFNGSLLNYILECLTIKCKYFTLTLTSNWCCSWRIIHQS